MSKKLLSLAMTMLLTLFATNVWAGYDYSMEYSNHLTGNTDRGDRKTTSVTLTGSVSGTHSVNTGQTGQGTPVFYDYTASTIWEVKPGETITPTMAYTGEWMHKFVYIDFGQDGKFDVHLTGSGPFTKGNNNDIVAWSCIDGYNSDGSSASNNGSAALPSFTLPADLAPGDYRCRFKVDWNDPTPYGTTKDFVSGAGIMVDVTLRVPANSLFDPNLTYTLQPSTNLSKYAATTVWDNNRYVMTNTAEGFKIVGNDNDGYTIQSTQGDNKYIGMGNNDWNSGNTATAWAITAVEGQENTYSISRNDNSGKGLGWDASTWAIFTDKTGLNWVIKTLTAVDYVVSYTLEGYDESLGDMFSVQVGDELVDHSKEFTQVKDVVVTATAGEGRMVTLKVNNTKVSSPYTITDCDYSVDVVAKFEGYRSPTATTQVYTTLGFFGDDMMDLFAKVDAEGRMFPTDEEFEAIGVSLADLAFVRSHVRPQEILSRATRFNTAAYEKRNLWMNVPIGVGKEVGGYPSSNFSDDAYTMWNYTNLFGSWNHSLLHCPGVAADCAHKNGTDIMGGIKFFESWTAGSGAAGWVGKCQLTSDNGYQSPTSGKKFKYVRPVVNALLYFGKDGINYNFEDTGYANLTDFHSCMYDYAAEIGFTNFHIGLYTAQSTLSTSNVSQLLGTYNASRPGKGQAYDTFLNYSGSNFQTPQNIAKSVQAVEAKGFTTEDVYQGAWIVSMKRSWTNLNAAELNKRMGIVLWGEHAMSRFYSYCNGTSAMDFQKNYQLLQDRFMGGGKRNVADRPTENDTSDWGDGLATFQGIAHYIPERSAIRHNLPFSTFFSTGNGEIYNYKGKKTLGTWYNLGQQDVVPTYRWLVYGAGTTTANAGVPYFTHTDSYIGGSSLCMDNTDAVDVILYRTQLTVSGNNPVARIARKRLAGAPAGNVSVIVKKNGSNNWIATQFPQMEGTEWTADTVALQGVSKGDVIDYIGLRTSGNTKDLLIGMLELDDDSQVTPAGIVESSVLAEVVEECQKSLSVKLRWTMDQTTGDRAQYGMIYNDECNVSYFELLYKNGEKGRVSEVGRTTSWSAYIGNLPMEDDTDPYVGVRAFSTDGKTYTDPVWVHITRAQKGHLPEALSSNGAYPAIILDNSSDGLTNALNMRYLQQFQIANSDNDFTYDNPIGTPYMADIAAGVIDKDADKTNYIFAEGYTVKVHQGQNATITLTRADFSDGLQYCTARGYADWDCSEGFDGEGDEVILALGESNAKDQNTAFTRPYTFTLRVPSDAKPGNSRLRFVFSDAWFPHPGAAGVTNKGFSIDFPMEITGNNPHREPAADTHDSGISDEPVGFSYETGVESAPAEGASEFVLVGDELVFQNVDKVWVYSTDGRLFRFVEGGVDRLSVEGLSGTMIVRMQCGNVMRSRKLIL